MFRSFQFANLFFVVCLVALGDRVDSLNTIFMEHVCGQTKSYNVRLNTFTSGILKSVRGEGWNKNLDCAVAFVPQPGASVVLSFYRYALAPSDQLLITDHDNHKVLLTGTGNFQDERKSVFSDGPVVVHYTSSNSSAEDNSENGFQLTFTQTQVLPCLSKHFQCDNKRCIDAHLACDGHNHCGDNSDQQHCAPKNQHQDQLIERPNIYYKNSLIGNILAVTLSLATLVAIIVVTSIYSVRRRKELALQKAQEENPEGHPHASTSNGNHPGGTSTVPSPNAGVAVTEVHQKTASAGAVQQNPVQEHQVEYQVPALYPSIAPGVLDHPPTAPDFE